jgi:LDH2 family malate/lactate/ureidoglycolate dehydrogenase
MSDGQRGFVTVISSYAVDPAIIRARFYGVVLVTIRDANKFGRAAYYQRRAANEELVGVAATNTPAVMVPAGGFAARLEKNPFAIAAPLPAGRPLCVLDMEHSPATRSRITLAEMYGAAIPPDLAVGLGGTPTTDPTEALGGALLLFGGCKGYGLAWAVELLASVPSGAAISHEPLNTGMTAQRSPAIEVLPHSAVGSAYLAIDPPAFLERDGYVARMGRPADSIKAPTTFACVDEVLLPSEFEARSEAEADRASVALESPAIAGLERFGREYGLAVLTAFTEGHDTVDAFV